MASRTGAADDDSKFAKWEKSIAAFEEADRVQAPAKNGVVFVGSSSIRMWDVKRSFPELPVVNRGFGGSQVCDTLYFFDRIVKPYAPSVVVLHAAGNDLNAGKSPETVMADFKALVAKLHESLPATKLIYMCAGPSPQRIAA